MASVIAAKASKHVEAQALAAARDQEHKMDV